MKLISALKVIEQHNREQNGFRIKFCHINGGTVSEDEIPARDEAAISTIEEAEDLAKKFAEATKEKCINIKVVYAQNGEPVHGRKVYNKHQ